MEYIVIAHAMDIVKEGTYFVNANMIWNEYGKLNTRIFY